MAEQGDELNIVFRDHSMSDQVGFHYRRTSPGRPPRGDFLGKLHAIGDACRQNSATLVPVILDGENCWEYYPDGGRLVPPLALSERGARSQVRAGDRGRIPPRSSARPIPSPPLLGSWISHNFAIWIGHPEDNRAWDALHATRQFLVRRGRVRSPRPRGPGAAWDEIYIAEGSDWFWWYGDDHSSALDAALRSPVPQAPAKRLLPAVPGSSRQPIYADFQAVSHRPIHDQPTSFLDVRSMAARPTSSGSTRPATFVGTSEGRWPW